MMCSQKIRNNEDAESKALIGSDATCKDLQNKTKLFIQKY